MPFVRGGKARLPGKRGSRKMSHSRAGRRSGLTSRGAALKYLSTKIRAGQDGDLDSWVHGQMDMARHGCASSGRDPG